MKEPDNTPYDNNDNESKIKYNTIRFAVILKVHGAYTAVPVHKAGGNAIAAGGMTSASNLSSSALPNPSISHSPPMLSSMAILSHLPA
jgi:hypothetical protein